MRIPAARVVAGGVRGDPSALCAVRAAVERARAAATQASDTLRRMEPLLSHGYVSAEDVDRARVAQRATQAELSAALMLGEEIPLTKALGGGYRANPPVELTPR